MHGRRRGFTLIETVISIVITGLMMSFAAYLLLSRHALFYNSDQGSLEFYEKAEDFISSRGRDFIGPVTKDTLERSTDIDKAPLFINCANRVKQQVHVVCRWPGVVYFHRTGQSGYYQSGPLYRKEWLAIVDALRTELTAPSRGFLEIARKAARFLGQSAS